MIDRLLRNIKRIAYEPTRAERIVYADVILQQITSIVEIESNVMAVMIRKNKPGIILGYDPDYIELLTDAQLCTMLSHETQHIRVDDMNVGQTYVEPRDWYKSWPGQKLHNWARDCQINDEIVYKLGMRHVPDGAYGKDMLGHMTETQHVEAVMREIADKFPPPPKNGDCAANGELKTADEQDKEENQVKIPGASGGAKHTAPQIASISRTPEQARFDRFLAEQLDTRKYTESWFRVPKRLTGVREFERREAVVSFKTPLPRRCALVAIDVSGSMDTAGVERLCNLIRSAPANYDLTVVCFDDDIAPWTDFRTNQQMPRRGGGTDFDLVETYAKKMMRYPDTVLVLTDGGGEVPEVRWPKNWTWVIYGQSALQIQNNFKMRAVDLDAIIQRGRR